MTTSNIEVRVSECHCMGLDSKYRFILLFFVCIIFYRRIRVRMSETTTKDLSLRQIYEESIEYALNYCKRRPFMSALIALEVGSYAYFAIKKWKQSLVWKNTILELTLKGDYTVYT